MTAPDWTGVDLLVYRVSDDECTVLRNTVPGGKTGPSTLTKIFEMYRRLPGMTLVLIDSRVRGNDGLKVTVERVERSKP